MEQVELAELYRRFAPVIYRRCLSILRNTDEAADATQDVFVTLQRKLDTFRGDSEVMTWIYRIATNHCLNLVRSRKTQRRAMASIGAESEQRPRNGRDMAATVERRDLIRRLLGRFDARKVQIVFHHYYDEMTQAEIAQVLGISERAVRKALKKVKDRIKAEGADLTKLGEDQ